MGMTANVWNTATALKNIGAGLGALSSVAGGISKASQANAEAAALRLEGRQNAENILRATSQRVGAARAATAASGVKIDEFSLANENAIQRAGESDAAMTILNGRMAARSRQSQGRVALARGLGGGVESLLKLDISNWKGAIGDVSSPSGADAPSATLDSGSDPYSRFRIDRT